MHLTHRVLPSFVVMALADANGSLNPEVTCVTNGGGALLPDYGVDVALAAR